MKTHPFYPPLGLTREEVALAYQEAGSMEKAAALLGCSYNTVEHHLHRSGVKVRRYNGAFQHVRGRHGGIIRVRLKPDEESTDTLPPPKRGRP